jgi:hypothetical protein
MRMCTCVAHLFDFVKLTPLAFFFFFFPIDFSPSSSEAVNLIAGMTDANKMADKLVKTAMARGTTDKSEHTFTLASTAQGAGQRWPFFFFYFYYFFFLILRSFLFILSCCCPFLLLRVSVCRPWWCACRSERKNSATLHRLRSRPALRPQSSCPPVRALAPRTLLQRLLPSALSRSSSQC